jgi:imidazolonepropionase-like amidohydrolase
MRVPSGFRPGPLLALGIVAVSALNVAAQDAAITNARIIVGNGAVIPSGSIMVRGGKIVSVGAGSANTQGLKVIDAKGMRAMPGFIDAHKHINTGPQEKEQMQSLLESGYTTNLSRGGPGAMLALVAPLPRGFWVMEASETLRPPDRR